MILWSIPSPCRWGGDDPALLAEAARLAQDWGYDEINLNVGCPSQKVQAGNFGACLMAEPDLVARCVEAMVDAGGLPVTVKHRIGIDDLDSDALLTNFVDRVALAGASRFAVHARKAWLEGLDPKQNRTMPPLQHERVVALKQRRPDLVIELNGGLESPEDCLQALEGCDGAMVGRAAYSHPLRWTSVDALIFGEESRQILASDVVNGLLPHAAAHLERGGRLWDLCRHLVQLVEGVRGARHWRRELGRKPSAQGPIWMCCSMPGSSSRTQGSDQRLRSALSSAVTGIVIATATGRSTATTAATFVVGIALTSVVASAIAAVFPAP